MKLLDFTGRKVDPSLLLGDMKTKKEKDPNIKVRRFPTEKNVIGVSRCTEHTNPTSPWSFTHPRRKRRKLKPKQTRKR